MSCTFDAACLTSAVSGAQPSFAFSSNDASYFGIPAQFTDSSKSRLITRTTEKLTTLQMAPSTSRSVFENSH